MSSKGFQFTETDSGTKEKAKRALGRTHRDLGKKFREAAESYWWKVWETARQLCIEFGAFDTGTLYESIRLIWQYEPYGGLYEVGVSSAGVNMYAMIKVGGMEYINPKTGRVCNYAQAVHDGTQYMAARPFLTDAIAICEGYLQAVLQGSVDEALTGFERDY